MVSRAPIKLKNHTEGTVICGSRHGGGGGLQAGSVPVPV